MIFVSLHLCTEDTSLGGYTISLVLDNQRFIVVPDTGSSLLLVSGAEIVRSVTIPKEAGKM